MAIEISQRRSASGRHVTAGPLGHRRPRLAAACAALVTLSACAAVTPPPRFSAVSPADADGPESAVEPATPILTGDGELAEKAKPPRSEGPPEMPGMQHGAGAESAPVHGGHRASPPAAGVTYSCPVHPEVSSQAAATCPLCGRALVRKADRPEEPKR